MMLTQLEHRAAEDWLLGVDNQHLVELTRHRLQKLISLQSTQPYPTIFLAESDPVRFLAGFIAACSTHCPIFLCNPHWAAAEWQQVFSLARPDLIFGSCPLPPHTSYPLPSSPAPKPGWIMIPTGGSSGQVRFAIHTWETLTAAVRGFQDFFAVDRVNSCCVLPLHHVSGLMQFLRSFVSGGKLAVLPFKALERALESPLADFDMLTDSALSTVKSIEEQCCFDPTNFFLSLVPTQLQRLLQHSRAIDWLRQFQTIFLGGAPAWIELLNAARSYQLPLAPTYGMTETAAQVATLKPELFLQGKNGCGQVLPHAAVEIYNSAAKAPLQAEQTGTIAIRAKSLMLGYFPDASYPEKFLTDDLGYFDVEILQVVGRNSQKIITGGENVFPAEVEAALRSTQLVRDVCVVGMPDQTWGEVVTAFYVPGSQEATVSALKAALASQLCHFKHPKQWIAVKSLPRNAQGKINVEHLKQIL